MREKDQALTHLDATLRKSAASFNGTAIYGQPGLAWNVINDGTIVSNSGTSASVGIRLKSGGTVSNGAAGSIAGQSAGIRIEGAAGTVANSGTIAAAQSSGFGVGVELTAGGSVTNGQPGSSAGRLRSCS